MLKIINFLKKNKTELILCFLLFAINSLWYLVISVFFVETYYSENTFNYLMLLPTCSAVVYLILKKFNSSEFLLFPPLRFLVINFTLHILIFNLTTNTFVSILNRQKYVNLEGFLIETYEDQSAKSKITFLEKIYNKLFNKNS
ncbi:hypothetical protein [Chryseobacterium sp. FDAARGOS 1104]|uniref:Uncharacterized protein n=1 Tax=Chryseobacterium taihuense TaxID=1141221 RepID=A0A4U8WNM2_9FLAO|nr:hypothetical protein [Chryseobacterium sp. FDAARGOS 1104]QQV02205.1 hypothetical protein I6I61_14175 [Chryseobacterium sp. FDAARGOS 1104]VFB04558.1 Uncharacterised protein [Chryseobacterium taihuense]